MEKTANANISDRLNDKLEKVIKILFITRFDTTAFV